MATSFDTRGLAPNERQQFTALAELIQRLYDVGASSDDRIEAYDLLTMLEFYNGFPPEMNRQQRLQRLSAVMARFGVGRFKTHTDRPACYVGIRAK
jgi:hypothetical protein